MNKRVVVVLAGLLTLRPCGFAVAAAGPPAAPLFEDVARGAGLVTPHASGMAGRYYMPEIMGSGVAFLDYDGDSDLDIYLVSGLPPAGDAQGPRDRLYRNDSQRDASGRMVFRFADVTRDSRITPAGYGMGIATGDYDNDGRVDLYLTSHGRNQLFRNLGDGTFRDVTEASGTGVDTWSSSAAFFDYDADGWLDLYVATYLNVTLANNQICPSPAGEPDYCGPVTYRPLQHRLLRNRGDGGFEDVSRSAGILAQPGSGLGVVTADLDRDGRLDLFVGNDKMPNFLWLQQPDRTFREACLARGCAFDENGQAPAGMGVDAGDVDGDGAEDLIVVHLAGETNTLYLNRRGFFEDATLASGLGPPSLPFTTFGVVWFDYDGDGWLDLATVNGHVHRLPALVEQADPFPYHQRAQLFRNLGSARFVEIGKDAAGPGFAAAITGRGLARGDVDNDGDIDLLISSTDGVPELLINQRAPGQSWLGLRLVGASGRDMQGASVRLAAGGLPLQVRSARTDGSYLSAHDPRVVLALAAPGPAEVQVSWPDGRRERFVGLEAGRYHVLRQGTGVAPADSAGQRVP